MIRPARPKTTLLRLGVHDPGRAQELLPLLGDAADPVLAVLGRTADPDQALEALVRLVEADPDPATLLRRLGEDDGTALRLLSVLGASEALADHLVLHPGQWHDLEDPLLDVTRMPAYWMREELLRAVGADPHAPSPTSTLPDAEALDALRVGYRRLLLRIAARDLSNTVAVDDAAAELSDLAAGTLEAALAVARTRVGERAPLARLAVIAMGKCGGHELNYVSDVDVIFVHEPGVGPDGAEVDPDRALRVASQLAGHLIRVCSDHTSEGTIWPVDAALRPEGQAGALSRTLSGHLGYYEKWASTWEFQALLKARPVAGDAALGREYVAMLSPMVWQAAEREGFVPDTQAMRRRVLEHIPAKQAGRQLKLGEGGLRDVEFAVQLLQLVHGRADETLREPTTLSALAALTRGGYVGRQDGTALHEAYAFLRRLEHRIQLRGLRRLHVVPSDPEDLRRLGRSLGFYKQPEESLERAWQEHRREVRRLHEKLFYRPLLSAVAQLPGEEARLTLEAAGARLAALGFDHPEAALRHLEALTAGVSRKTDIQRALLPAMLYWFAEAPDPDAGLFGFRRISESLGDTPWYLRTLRDEGEVAHRLAQVLGTSRYITTLLEREPKGVKLLGEPLAPLPLAQLTEEMRSSAARFDDPEKAVRAIRAVRRRELLRIAVGDLLDLTDVADIGAGLSRITDATLEATLRTVAAAVCRARGLEHSPTRLAIIAMGRYGGFELSYGSDADVLFVHQPVDGADPQDAAGFARAVVGDVRRLLALPGGDPPLDVDADLRPEGRQGPLVRTLDSYAGYYARWHELWETQALLRAEAVVGDEGLRQAFTRLIDPLRYPEGGLSEDQVREIRRIKARVDNERLPRGADPKGHLKLGPGGLADIEWTVQLLQLSHAGEIAGLRTPRTLDALRGAAEHDLITTEDAEVLIDTWRTVSRARNAVTLVRGKAADQLPGDARESAAVAQVMGYPAGATGDHVNDLQRSMRRARMVVDRVFWE